MKIMSKNLFDTDKLPAFLIIASVLVFAVGIVTSVVKTAMLNINYIDDREVLVRELSKTESGRYAVEKFDTCMKSGAPLSKKPTSASCSVEAVNSAKVLHGEPYSVEVRDAVLKLDALYSKYPD